MTARELDLRRKIFAAFAATGAPPDASSLDPDVLAEIAAELGADAAVRGRRVRPPR